MPLNRGLLALILVFIIVFSLAGLLQRQKEFDNVSKINAVSASNLAHQFTEWTFLETFSFERVLVTNAPLSDNVTRTQISNFINSNPGVQFRAICSSLGLSIGVVQFHITILERTGIISSIRNGKYKRFFTAHQFSRKQMETIAALRLNTVRNILKTLLQRKNITHHQLAAQLSISSQGLTWQMNRLRETGLIQENRNHFNLTYAIEKTQVSMITETLTILEN
jgi:predicted transcriptional regulator